MPVTASNIEDRPVSAAAAAAATEEKELMDAPPDVRLLVKRRQMFEVQEALEAQKQQYAAQVSAWRAELGVLTYKLRCALPLASVH